MEREGWKSDDSPTRQGAVLELELGAIGDLGDASQWRSIDPRATKSRKGPSSRSARGQIAEHRPRVVITRLGSLTSRENPEQLGRPVSLGRLGNDEPIEAGEHRHFYVTSKLGV